MPTVKDVSREKANSNPVISDEIQNPAGDAFVLKKITVAKEILNRPGIQEQLKNLAHKYEEKA